MEGGVSEGNPKLQTCEFGFLSLPCIAMILSYLPLWSSWVTCSRERRRRQSSGCSAWSSRLCSPSTQSSLCLGGGVICNYDDKYDNNINNYNNNNNYHDNNYNYYSLCKGGEVESTKINHLKDDNKYMIYDSMIDKADYVCFFFNISFIVLN